ncbi:MAG: phosphatidylglycerophosphatase A [Myxococcota bacterium]
MSSRVFSNGFLYALGIWFGAGLVPLAPGTAGTFFAIPLYVLLMMILRLPMWAYIIFCIAFIFVAFVAAKRVGDIHCAPDDQRIVIDEVAGYLVSTIALVPSFSTIVITFVLFRMFDMVKIFPVNYFDKKLKNHYGCVLDDVMAGIYAAILAQLLGKLLARAGWLQTISDFWG